jgi:hypothetical protein
MLALADIFWARGDVALQWGFQNNLLAKSPRFFAANQTNCEAGDEILIFMGPDWIIRLNLAHSPASAGFSLADTLPVAMRTWSSSPAEHHGRTYVRRNQRHLIGLQFVSAVHVFPPTHTSASAAVIVTSHPCLTLLLWLLPM